MRNGSSDEYCLIRTERLSSLLLALKVADRYKGIIGASGREALCFHLTNVLYYVQDSARRTAQKAPRAQCYTSCVVLRFRIRVDSMDRRYHNANDFGGHLSWQYVRLYRVVSY